MESRPGAWFKVRETDSITWQQTMSSIAAPGAALGGGSGRMGARGARNKVVRDHVVIVAVSRAGARNKSPGAG